MEKMNNTNTIKNTIEYLENIINRISDPIKGKLTEYDWRECAGLITNLNNINNIPKENDSTKSKMIEVFESMKGEFVILNNKVVRLVAVGETIHKYGDYYFISYDGRKLEFHLERPIKLAGNINDKDYNEFIRIAKLNHYDFLYSNTSQDNDISFFYESLFKNEKDLELFTEYCFTIK